MRKETEQKPGFHEKRPRKTTYEEEWSWKTRKPNKQWFKITDEKRSRKTT